MKYWIFDLDGTLIDSFSHFFTIVQEFVPGDLSSKDKLELISIRPDVMFAEKLSPEAAKHATEELHRRSVLDAPHVPAFSAVQDLFAHLRSQGAQIGVWTARNGGSAHDIVKNAAWGKYVSHVIDGDMVTYKKPHPEGLEQMQAFFGCKREEMVMVGDHDHDMEAARTFGVLAVRASWHPHWEHASCSRAHHQFHCDQKFLDWVKERTP